MVTSSTAPDVAVWHGVPFFCLSGVPGGSWRVVSVEVTNVLVGLVLSGLDTVLSNVLLLLVEFFLLTTFVQPGSLSCMASVRDGFFLFSNEGCAVCVVSVQSLTAALW